VRTRVFLLLFAFLPLALFGEDQIPQSLSPFAQLTEVPPPELLCRAAAMLDVDTGTILYEKDPYLAIPPASLTKLMTLHIVYEKIDAGEMALTDIVPISTRAWAKNLPPRSSLMFLEPGQRVTLLELMKGLALPSGNDAAIAVAEYVAGSVPDFVALKNEEALRLGFLDMHFADASGLSARNSVNAREFVEFCRIYVRRHPDAIGDLHSLTEFVFPTAENLPSYTLGSRQPLVRGNHNDLLGRMEGVNGLKTGYIDESGYNIALSATRGRSNLLAVILGVPGSGSQDGALNRAIDSAALLSYGFYAFATLRPAMEMVSSIRVYKGRERYLPLSHDEPLVTVRREDARLVEGRFFVPAPVVAPVKKGDVVGHIIVSAGDRELRRYPVTAEADLPRGGGLRVFFDSVALFFKRLFKR